jgi:hypothetical protein
MMDIDELRTKLCQQYSSDAEAADAIATANDAVADATGEPYQTPGHPDSIGQD